MKLRQAWLLQLVLGAQGWVLYSPTRKQDAVANIPGYANIAGDKVWKDPSTFNLSESVLRWGLPSNPYITEALARGVSWALHPDFCEDLLGQFPEENFNVDLSWLGWERAFSFLSCDDLTTAVRSSFDMWSLNHDRINFFDVSDKCAEPGSLANGSTDCPAAELFLIVTPETESSTELAAYVKNDVFNIDRSPILTSGREQTPGRGLLSSTMTVSRGICWYLDTTFCYNFHRLDDSGWDVVLLMRMLFVVISVLCGLVVLWLLTSILKAALCPRVSKSSGGHVEMLTTVTTPRSQKSQKSKYVCGGKRCDSALDALSNMPMGILLFCLFWLFFMPIFYYRVFLPCWECYDFTATIAHEVGHVLGFHHPNVYPELNLRATAPMGPETCQYPLNHVEYEPLPEDADSVMYSVTKHRSKTCLTLDDLEGLNFLYPTCEGARTEPECVDNQRLSGWLRLGVAVGIPYVLVTLLLFCCQCGIRSFQRRKVRKLEENVGKLRKQASRLRREGIGMREQLEAVNNNMQAWAAKHFQSSRSRIGAIGRSASNLRQQGSRMFPTFRRRSSAPSTPRRNAADDVEASMALSASVAAANARGRSLSNPPDMFAHIAAINGQHEADEEEVRRNELSQIEESSERGSRMSRVSSPDGRRPTEGRPSTGRPSEARSDAEGALVRCSAASAPRNSAACDSAARDPAARDSHASGGARGSHGSNLPHISPLQTQNAGSSRPASPSRGNTQAVNRSFPRDSAARGSHGSNAPYAPPTSSSRSNSPSPGNAQPVNRSFPRSGSPLSASGRAPPRPPQPSGLQPTPPGYGASMDPLAMHKV